ncbi:MAG: hypothetical protein IPH74_13545 [Bacteroidetes bacterium]|nr:hypothetical protein [Bacteroidota bacterium]MBK8671889.1 hypothetical protein [Bacteroidota bacterium]MBK9633983.1 hypothetical protein [Bacteroidota bacterium]
MDIQTRKIEFIQAFLKLESEEVISQFEVLLSLKSDYVVKEDKDIKPISIREFNKRMDKSEDDFKNGRYKNTAELLKKFS